VVDGSHRRAIEALEVSADSRDLGLKFLDACLRPDPGEPLSCEDLTTCLAFIANRMLASGQ
jgi:hypothetical protein